MASQSILVYGAGGMGKSTRAVEAAVHVWRTSGKRTRVVNSDGGGTQEAFHGLVKAGIADLWNIDQWEEKSIFHNLTLATKGFWPEDLLVPNSRLLEPVREWRACPTCKGDSGAKGLTMVPKCAACGQTFAAGQLLPVQREAINGMEKVGLYVFEGMTSFGENLLQRLKKIDASGGNSISDGEFKIAGSGQQHYLMAQKAIAEYVTNARNLPVELVVWTALEIRSDDDGKPLYGPQGPGKKLTSLCIPWFTSVIHLDGFAKRVAGSIAKDANGVEILERKMYLAPHFASDNPSQRFAAKTSAPYGGGMPTVLDPDMSLFFKELEKAKEKAQENLLKGNEKAKEG